jgi:hypothetical protein
MKKRQKATLDLIYGRPVSGSIRWADIEALFAALGAEISEREGSRVLARCASFIARIPHRIRIKARLRASENGWMNTE